MKQENKELLLKDLCARLPYGVKINAKYSCIDTNIEVEKVGVLSMVDNDAIIAFTCDDTNCYNYVTIHDIKPYLFPLSSMSEEQCYKLASIRSEFQDCWKYIKTPIPLSICNFEQIDWFNKNHFDYRGLIEKSLAVDATNLNIY